VSRFDGQVELSYPAIASDGTVIVGGEDNVFAVSEDACEGQLYDLHWPEDLYGDGIVNFRDFALYASELFSCTHGFWGCPFSSNNVYGRVYVSGDLNRDYYVDYFDFSDLKILVDRWLRTD
jgi:hypothetical protein